MCASDDLTKKKRADENERQSQILRAENITFTIWDKVALSALLKTQPEIVDDFFGRVWVQAFCGDEAATALKTCEKNRFSPEERKGALVAYRAQLARELATVTYRGIAGLSTGERAVELLLNQVFVLPTLLTEEQRAKSLTRERVVLDHLSDPDLPAEAREQLETENVALALGRWKAQPQDLNVSDESANLISPQSGSEERLSTGEILWEKRHCVIFGSAGAGKSTLARWLAHLCAQGDQELNERLGWSALPLAIPVELPILVSLTSYAHELDARATLSLTVWLEEVLEKRGGPVLVAAFRECFAKGTCWAFFDGVDEIGSPALRASVVRELETWQRECGENRCLITSRLHGSAALAGGLTRLYLSPLDPDEVTMFIIVWHWTLAHWLNAEHPDEEAAAIATRDLLIQIRSNANLSTLSSNPLLLLIMILIYRERKYLPEQRAELYEAIVNTLLDTWNHWRSVAAYDRGGATLPPATLARVLAKVALWARRDNLNNVLPRAELLRELARALAASGVTENDLEATAQSYLNAIEKAGVLEERAPGMFAFWHPALEEFLAARELCSPGQDLIEHLLPLRHDPRWREVILLAVGCLGILRGEKAAATTVVGALADYEPDTSEALLHRHLRLAMACLQDDGKGLYLHRSLAQKLLARLADVVRQQPFEPMGGEFRDTVRAMPHLIPNDDLVKALAELVTVDHTRGETQAEALRLLSNAAPTHELARKTCAKFAHDDEYFLEKDAQTRFHAAIGLVRAEEITPHILIFLTGCGLEMDNIAYVVELLGLKSETGHVTPLQKQRRLTKLRALLAIPTPEDQKPLPPDTEDLSVAGRLAAALILLFAGENSSEVSAVLQDALQPINDVSGAVFDAAQAAFWFPCGDEQQMLETQRVALCTLRRWLTHPVAERRVHSAALLLDFMDNWEQRAEESSTPDELLATSDNFEEIYQQPHQVLYQECLNCFDSCLYVPNWQTCIIAAHNLLDRKQFDHVA